MDPGNGGARELRALRIAGLDEVGRGPLFGPVVAAAVILPKGCRLDGLTDSKSSRKKRNELDVEIRANAVAWAIAAVDAETIDRINIRQATLLAMRMAVDQLPLSPDYLLIDGRDTIEWDWPQRAVVQGDATSFSIARPACWPRSTATGCWWSWTGSFLGMGWRAQGLWQPGTSGGTAAIGTDAAAPPKLSPGYADGADALNQYGPIEAEIDLDMEDCEPPLDADAPATGASGETCEPRFACPCCGNLTLGGEPPGTFLLCEVCWWEDDPLQFASPEYVDGANAPSLEQAREFFKSIGVSDPAAEGPRTRAAAGRVAGGAD